MAKHFADFRPSISRRSGHKKFHAKLATNSAGHETKFFHRETLELGGATFSVADALPSVAGERVAIREANAPK